MKAFTASVRNLATAAAMAVAASGTLAADPAESMLDPVNHTLILIDHQPQMAFATHSHDIVELRNNVTGLAKAAAAFEVPTILTTVAEESFSGPLFPEVQAVFPDQKPIDRTTMNTWEDDRVVDVVEKTGNKKLVFAALWTEVCGVGPVLSAKEEGYDVYFVTDASGGVSKEAHDMADHLAAVHAGTAARLVPRRDLRGGDLHREGAWRRLRPRHHLREVHVRCRRRQVGATAAPAAARAFTVFARSSQHASKTSYRLGDRCASAARGDHRDRRAGHDRPQRPGNDPRRGQLHRLQCGRRGVLRAQPGQHRAAGDGR